MTTEEIIAGLKPVYAKSEKDELRALLGSLRRSDAVRVFDAAFRRVRDLDSEIEEEVGSWLPDSMCDWEVRCADSRDVSFFLDRPNARYYIRMRHGFQNESALEGIPDRSLWSACLEPPMLSPEPIPLRRTASGGGSGAAEDWRRYYEVYGELLRIEGDDCFSDRVREPLMKLDVLRVGWERTFRIASDASDGLSAELSSI